MELETAKIDGFIARYGPHQGALIQVLQDIQGEFNYLPREALEYVSEKLGTPLAVTYNVATFYNMFSLRAPRGGVALRPRRSSWRAWPRRPGCFRFTRSSTENKRSASPSRNRTPR